MRLKITNFRSVKSADTKEARILMVTGLNQSGKTSLLESVASTLLGEQSVFGSTQKDMSDVITTGEQVAECLVGFEQGGVSQMIWPGKPFSRMPVPMSNKVTVGRVDPAASYDPKEWADFIRTLSCDEAKIAGSDVRKRLEQIRGQTGPRIKLVMDGIRDSWDGFAKIAKDRSLTARREWMKTTGSTGFGEKTAEAWKAEHFVPGDSVEGLQANIGKVRDAIAVKNAHDSIGELDLKSLDEIIRGTRQKILEAEHNLCMTNKLIKDAELRFKEYPTGSELVCPCCGKKLVLVGNKLEEVGTKSCDSPEYRQLVKELGELATEQAQRMKAVQEAKAELTDHQSTRRIAETLKADEDPRSLDDLELELSGLEKRFNALKTMVNAGEHLDVFVFFNRVAELLGPTGIRLEFTKKSVPDIQRRIDEVSKFLFKGHKVELRIEEEGLRLYFDGQSYEALTWNGDPNSYRLRTKYLFQLIEAQGLGPDAPVILDRADTLDRGHLNGLLTYLAKNNVQALIARTLPKKPEQDLLRNGNAGLTYWINDGKLEPV